MANTKKRKPAAAPKKASVKKTPARAKAAHKSRLSTKTEPRKVVKKGVAEKVAAKKKFRKTVPLVQTVEDQYPRRLPMRFSWDPKSSKDTDQARAIFETITEKGLSAFTVTAEQRPGVQIDTFDPKLGVMAFLKMTRHRRIAEGLVV